MSTIHAQAFKLILDGDIPQAIEYYKLATGVEQAPKWLLLMQDHDVQQQPPRRSYCTSMSSITPPADWKGKFVPTLDVLLFVREQVLSGIMPEMFFGRLDVGALCAFVEGIHFHLYCCGVHDEGYMEFVAWLRDVKDEFPSPTGWEGKYLSEFSGDHRAAIMKFLDRCAEFVDLRRPARPG